MSTPGPSPTRILLCAEASAALTEAGAEAFVVIGKASYPDDPKRWVLHLLPVSIADANKAARAAIQETDNPSTNLPQHHAS